jgi:hypothetical protein
MMISIGSGFDSLPLRPTRAKLASAADVGSALAPLNSKRLK